MSAPHPDTSEVVIWNNLIDKRTSKSAHFAQMNHVLLRNSVWWVFGCGCQQQKMEEKISRNICATPFYNQPYGQALRQNSLTTNAKNAIEYIRRVVVDIIGLDLIALETISSRQKSHQALVERTRSRKCHECVHYCLHSSESPPRYASRLPRLSQEFR